VDLNDVIGGVLGREPRSELAMPGFEFERAPDRVAIAHIADDELDPRIKAAGGAMSLTTVDLVHECIEDAHRMFGHEMLARAEIDPHEHRPLIRVESRQTWPPCDAVSE
jgi:hypothetical protein